MARRSAAHAAKTRADILKAARALFSAHGFAATTSEDIARSAGVTVGAVFHHFAGKKDLFRAVFVELEAEMLEAARAAQGGADALAAFLAGVRAYLAFVSRPDFQRIAMIDGPAVLSDAEWSALERRPGLGALRDVVAELIRTRAIPPQQVEPLAYLLFGALNAAALAIAHRSPGAEPEGFVAALEALLRRSG